VTLDAFKEVWVVDTEFYAPAGERPDPVCVVARELRSGRLVRQWRGEFSALPPFRTDAQSLYVAFYASAECGTHLALNWPLPTNLIDCFSEFRSLTNGVSLPAGRGELGALVYYGLDHISGDQKEAGRGLVMRGGPWSEEERARILDYCQSDVDSLAQLFTRMALEIDFPRALLRGRFMKAAAAIEWRGVPIDVPTFTLLKAQWENIKTALIADIDQDYGVYDGTSFRQERFERYLARERIPWPRLPGGQLDLKDKTFREIAKSEPRISPLRELRSSLSELRLSKLSVGHDGRNRALLSVFASKTGRNQPSNAKFVFGPSVWLRGLIRPERGSALVYADWSSQEFGIAASLSGDERMLEAYRSGDPYLTTARLAGAVPPEATKETHKRERDLFKVTTLAVSYGMGSEGLALRLGILPLEARELLRKFRETYPRFWRWSQNNVDAALIGLDIQTVFGWHQSTQEDPNPRSIQNFPMQGNGSEMLRIAACLGTERGIGICAPVHDAFLAEAPAEEIEEAATALQRHMRTASRIVLAGFELRTDATIIRWPDRYDDPRGRVMWRRVMRLLNRVESAAYG